MDVYPSLNLNASVSEIFRKTKDVDPELLERYIHNRAVDEPAYTILIITYSLLIVIGALGNTLVVSTSDNLIISSCGIPNSVCSIFDNDA